MIKAAGQAGDGTPLLILGLSAENMARLLSDQPISFDLAELGLPPARVVIVGGQTEEIITGQLTGHGLLPKPAGRD